MRENPSGQARDGAKAAQSNYFKRIRYFRNMTIPRFLIVTHVMHTYANGNYYAYGPYVREMNLWIKNAQHVIIVAPLSKQTTINPIDICYTHNHVTFIRVPSFQLTNGINVLKSLWVVPYIMTVLLLAMFKANHIHLRCPGNMGLLGSITQLFFPFKKKTAKYAGNWDWQSQQPFTYRLQQRLLRNTILTHRMKTLVYGEWHDRTKNIVPFFTASYSEKDRLPIEPRTLKTGDIIKLMFVGALESGKNPIDSLLIAHELIKRNAAVEIHFYGEGSLRDSLEKKIITLNMQHNAFVHGNVNSATLKDAYRDSHFMVLLSDSEGWPKAVAEAMWWGCVPVTTQVSCVPWMLANGERGVIAFDLVNAVANILSLINSPKEYSLIAYRGVDWSRQYTLEKFELEIQKLV